MSEISSSSKFKEAQTKGLEKKPSLSRLLDLLRGIKEREEDIKPELLDEIHSLAAEELQAAKERKGGFKFRKVDPPQELLTEIAFLDRVIEDTKLERLRPAIRDMHRNARDHFSQPLKPAAPEEPKKK